MKKKPLDAQAPNPTEGGSYTADPVTGALLRNPPVDAPAQEPQPVVAPDDGSNEE